MKLKNEDKIKIVEPSNEIKNSYIIKSESSFKSAEILIKNNQIEDAVSLIYYSMYYLVTALLFKIGIKCKNHSATIIILLELLEIDNSSIIFAKNERVDKQYNIDFKITKEEVLEMFEIGKKFNFKIYDFIDRLTTKKCNEYLNEFRGAIF